MSGGWRKGGTYREDMLVARECNILYLIIMWGDGSGSALFWSLRMKKALHAATERERKERPMLIFWDRLPVLPVHKMMWSCCRSWGPDSWTQTEIRSWLYPGYFPPWRLQSGSAFQPSSSALQWGSLSEWASGQSTPHCTSCTCSRCWSRVWPGAGVGKHSSSPLSSFSCSWLQGRWPRSGGGKGQTSRGQWEEPTQGESDLQHVLLSKYRIQGDFQWMCETISLLLWNKLLSGIVRQLMTVLRGVWK